jgi:pimeloyl-ACP methyl ester carboxylesterase
MQMPSSNLESYCLYVPGSVRNVDSAPAIIFFDPHGSGRLPLDKYRKLADRFGIVLAGSNNSKNGMDISQSTQFGNNIISDITARIGIPSKLINLAGFSGGAKVALLTAANNPNITNAIYAGAATPVNSTHPLRLMGFAGTADMNYTDLLAFSGSHPEGLLVEFDGKHEWPDTNTFSKAFYEIYFRSGVQDTGKFNKNVRDFIAQTEGMIMAATTTKHIRNLLWAYDEASELTYVLDGVTDVSKYKKYKSDLSNDPYYKQALSEKKQLIQKEAAEKQILLASFQNQNGNWWSKTVSHYKTSSEPMDKRLLGFISLACYSYSSQLISRRDTAGAAHFLAIYELADADNTDQLYFYAVLYSQEGKPEQAIRSLSKAVEKGFKDWQKIEAEPEFTPLRGHESFSRLLTSLKRGSK